MMRFSRDLNKIIVLSLLITCSQSALAEIRVDTMQELVSALSQTEDTDIELSASINLQFNTRLDINSDYRIFTDPDNPATLNGNNTAEGAFSINDGARLQLEFAIVTGFTNSAITIFDNASLGMNGITCSNNGLVTTEGGCIRGSAVNDLEVLLSRFENNIASRGGAIFVQSYRTEITDSRFVNNSATLSGGDVTVIPNQISAAGNFSLPGLWVERNIFTGFNAGQFGGSLELLRALAGTVTGYEAYIISNVFSSTTQVPTLEFNVNFPALMLLNNFLINGALFNSVSPALLAAGNVSRNSTGCNVFGGTTSSLGHNITTTSRCPFNQGTDQLNTDPGFSPGDPTLSLQADSPAVEGQTGEGLLSLPSIVANLLPDEASSTLPCGVADATGLGRPQDGNGDGVFECDLGARELRNGPDISAAQTMAIFDTNRVGEGQFLEILPNGLAAMSFFTFGNNGGQDWFVGVGQQRGNTIVFDSINDPIGGVWGSAFNPNNITRSDAGMASLVFSTCQSTQQPGRFMFRSASGSDRSDLFNQASRLTSSIGCNGPATNPNAARTGSYFGGPARDGEGLQYIELDNGQATAVFYGYDPQGNKFWTTSSPAAVNGNTITFQMQYPAVTTGFGVNFDASEIQTEPFGTMVLTFNNNGTVNFNMTPIVDGFEPISYTMSRITTPLGLGG